MSNRYQYEQVNHKYTADAVSLVMGAYKEERDALPILPKEEELIEEVQRSIERLFSLGVGMMALSKSKLVGFLVGAPRENLFGEAMGVYTPLYGHGTINEDRSFIYQELYRETAREWVHREYLTHCLTLWGHDEMSVSTWFWLGFGLRCVDAICSIEKMEIQKSPFHCEVKKIHAHSISSLTKIHQLHHHYFNLSPLFMYMKEEDPFLDLKQWIQEENHHLFAAFEEGEPVGYIRLQPNAENFISDHPSIMNITGAYVMEDRRRNGIGQVLLRAVKEFLIKEGYPLCGVDYESFNIAGSSFWRKRFTPYTLSLQRRIDERILR